MVAKQRRPVFIFLIIACFLSGCNVDLPGFFGSSDLDTRLNEQDNFRFLSGEDRTRSFGEAFSFIVLTDTHIEKGNAYGLEKLKGEIDSEIKFVVICGDITQRGDRQDVEKFIEVTGSFGVPCYPVIGNHDIYSGNWPHWKDLIGSTRYRIDGGGAALFILDSANAFFGEDQLDWLDRELKSAEGRIFVFTHANPFLDNPAGFQQLTDIRERSRFFSVLRGRCDAMFSGHSHLRYVRETGGVQFINIDDFRSNRTYCRVSVTKAGISWEYKRL